MQLQGAETIFIALTPGVVERGDLPADAPRRLDEVIRSAFAKLLGPRGRDDHAPFLVVRATLGLGKSEAALRASGDAIRRGHGVVYFVPNHKLTDELKERADRMFTKMGVSARVRIWRGRDQPNPDNRPEKMCMNGDAAKAAQRARLDVHETVCRVCPHKDADSGASRPSIPR
jgi:hypothetical protein